MEKIKILKACEDSDELNLLCFGMPENKELSRKLSEKAHKVNDVKE